MEPRTVRLGVSPIAWTNDDLPELGGDTPLETCLADAHAVGFDGIELGGKFPRSAGELRPILAKHELSLVSGWYSARLLDRSVDAEIAALEPHLALLEAMGCDVLVFAETTGAIHGDRTRPLSQRPKLDADGMKRLGEATTRLGEHTRRRGVRLAVHHHMGTVVQSEDDVDALLAASGDAVHLLLDTGHMAYAAGEPAAVARRHAARIAHVHTKDVRSAVLTDAFVKDLPFLEAVLAGVFTVPGDGAIDYDPVLAALAAAGYAGWLVVEAEQDPARADPRTYARKGYDALLAVAARAGLERAPRTPRREDR
jgi:inosose dehydratase